MSHLTFSMPDPSMIRATFIYTIFFIEIESSETRSEEQWQILQWRLVHLPACKSSTFFHFVCLLSKHHSITSSCLCFIIFILLDTKSREQNWMGHPFLVGKRDLPSMIFFYILLVSLCHLFQVALFHLLWPALFIFVI